MRGLVAVALLAACSSGAPKRIGEQPSWRHGPRAGSTELRGTGTGVAPDTVTFAPTTKAASRYNEPLEAPPHTALGDAVLMAVTEAAVQANITAPVADARLFRACAELATIVPEEGMVNYGLVEFALQRNGIVEPSPHMLIMWGQSADPSSIVEQLKPQLKELLAERPTTIGVGAMKRTTDGMSAVVVAFHASAVATSPIPRAIAAGGGFSIDAVVDARYNNPELFVTYDDGSTERLPIVTGRSGGFKAKVACGKHQGRQQVEITATGSGGATVLANFPVWCGTEPPLSLTIKPTGNDDRESQPDEAERRLLALVNRDRQSAGLSPLLWDDRVADVARKYSDEMRRTKVVAHLSPTTGSATDRIRVANIRTSVVLENIARAYSVAGAHDGLMNSPGHRANIMAPSATHIGIGVVLGDDVSQPNELFVTQVFIRIPPKMDPGHANEMVLGRIETVRHVAVNVKLAAVAQQLADGLASGRHREDLWPGAVAQLNKLGNTYLRVGSVISAFADLESVDAKDLVGEYKPDEVGIGLAQGPHPDLGDGAIWVVVLMAEQRH